MDCRTPTPPPWVYPWSHALGLPTNPSGTCQPARRTVATRHQLPLIPTILKQRWPLGWMWSSHAARCYIKIWAVYLCHAGCGWIGECADSGIMWLDLMQHNSLMWSSETWIIATVQQGLRDHGWDCGHRAVRGVYRKTQRVINSSVWRLKFPALNSALKKLP